MITKGGAKEFALLLVKGDGPERNVRYVTCAFVLIMCNHTGTTYTQGKGKAKPPSMWLARLSARNAINAPW